MIGTGDAIFFNAVDDGTLPAVSFVKPDGLLNGHPALSKEDLFEGVVEKIVDHLKADKDLFASTAATFSRWTSSGTGRVSR